MFAAKEGISTTKIPKEKKKPSIIVKGLNQPTRKNLW